MAQQESLSFFEFKNKFNSEQACREHLFQLRWPDGFVCPKCGHTECYSLKTRPLHECKKCHYQASVTSGTVMDNTRVPLEKWFWAIYLVSTDKRGHSALQLQKEIKVSYKTAWFMLHRLRKAMMKETGITSSPISSKQMRLTSARPRTAAIAAEVPKKPKLSLAFPYLMTKTHCLLRWRPQRSSTQTL